MARVTHSVLVSSLIALTAHAQSRPPAVKSTTAGVLIDVSVLDNKGQPVLDLTPADFELSEDGKRQQLVSVTLVTGGVRGQLGAPRPNLLIRVLSRQQPKPSRRPVYPGAGA